jgi:hypothetical protein
MTLETSLGALGIDCRVEGRDRLAVLVPRGPVDLLADGRVRRKVLRLARDQGFTHIALELVAADQSTAADDERPTTATQPDGATLHCD